LVATDSMDANDEIRGTAKRGWWLGADGLPREARICWSGDQAICWRKGPEFVDL